MGAALKSITINHLRGSVAPFTLQFENKKKLTVIYGENGSGKSTICDAFEFIGKGNITSLDGRGLGKTSPYWCSIGKSSSQISVLLETTKGNCSAMFQKSNVIAHPAENKPQVEVLRRSQILALIESNPSNRYAAISSFVDVTGIEDSESTLRELIKSLKISRNEAISRVQENRDIISQFWETAGKPNGNAISWAASESKRDDNAYDAELNALIALKDSYSKLNGYPSLAQQALEKLNTAREQFDEAEEKLAECLSEVSSDATEMLSILESAREYLLIHPKPQECPLCGSAEKTTALAKQVEDRISAYEKLQQANAEKADKERSLTKANQELESLSAILKQYALDFNQCSKSTDLPIDTVLPSDNAPETLEALTAWLANSSSLPEDWKQAEIVRQDNKKFLKALKKAYEIYTSNYDLQLQYHTLLPNVEKTLAIVEKERHKYTSGILAQISTEVGRLYELVHPGEGLNKISLQLDPAKRASLDLGASFCGTSAPPQAYFSESHLDTLGLCVFLALASLDKPEETIIVLDDVLASVDEPHINRLIEMLYDETNKFQHTILTTHYRPWREKFRWGKLKPEQGCQFIELKQWSPTDGIGLSGCIPETVRLKTLLSDPSPDVQSICGKAGVILEAILDFLTLKYGCAVPRKVGETYTLGDLLPAVNGKLLAALKAESLEQQDGSKTVISSSELKPVLDAISQIASARNVMGAHFNTLSFESLDADAIAFAKHVEQLADMLICPDYGWPNKDKTGSYWNNGGDTRRLHPLKKPS